MEDDVAVFICGGMSSNEGRARKLTGLVPAEQSRVLHTPDEICESDIEHVLCVAILQVRQAAASETG